MAQAPVLPPEVLRRLAAQLSERASPNMLRTLTDRQPVGIAESFPIFALQLDSLDNSARPFASMVAETGVWHHQLRHGMAAHEFARSTVTGSAVADWNVAELGASGLAQKVESAIRWIDENVHDDSTVSMLTVPAYYLTGFWLHAANSDRILVIDAPEQYGSFTPFRLYDAAQFMSVLRGLAPAGGVIAD
jgi:hypothetical protein